jgi:ion channel-forming bestrophin family protein
MIVRKHLDYRIVIRVGWKRVVILLAISSFVVIASSQFGRTDLAIDSLPASILGVALSILLGFRVNSAYERWWEGRRLWGGIVNDSRSIARQSLSFFASRVGFDHSDETIPEEKRRFVYRQIAFVYALKNHLRKQDNIEEIKPFLDAGEFTYLKEQKNIPNAVLFLHAKHLEYAMANGFIEDFRHMQIDTRMNELCNSMGGCERIKNTIFPRQYSYYASIFIAIYTYFLPFILVGQSGWITIPFTVLIGFIFFALDSIARGIENPFENTFNDTPMSSICRTIEINLRQMLGEKDLPEPVQPVNGFLF